MDTEAIGASLKEHTEDIEKLSGRHGRPLSIIESSHEISSDEADFPSRIRTKESSDALYSSDLDAETSATSVGNDWEERIASLFARNAEAEDNEEQKTIKIKDLPRLLQAVEKRTGSAILDAQMLEQVELFAGSNPELVVQPASIVAMIRQLYAAREPEEVATSELAAQTKKPDTLNGIDIDSDTSSFSTSESEGELQESRDTVTHSPTSELRSESISFPRSISDRADLSAHMDETARKAKARKTTTSDPSVPTPTNRRASTPGEEVGHPSKLRPRNSSNTDREVLKGRGKVKAPPSSWSRPKPQALANRDRNRRISGSSTASGSFDGELDRIGSGSPSTASPRSSSIKLRDADTPERGVTPQQRLSSQPDPFDASISQTRPLPRSASSGSQAFIFPRAASPSGPDHYDAETSERWNTFVDEFRSGGEGENRQRERHEDERSTRTTNDILSPSLSASDFITRRSGGSRRSSGAGRRRRTTEYDDMLSSDEQVAALQAQLESVQRSLAEKNRSIEVMQRESEEYISRMQEEVESLKSDLALRRKEDSLNRVRENINLDNIAGLEADLNRSTTELETLRAQHVRLRSDHDDLVVAMERHTARAYEYREEIAKAKAQAEEAMEMEKQWELDRESYRETIKRLNDELATVQQSLLGHEEDGRMIASLQANIDSLNVELDEARNRGSNANPSRVASEAGGTLSKRLGAELAKSLVTSHTSMKEAEEQMDEDDDEEIDEEEVIGQADGDLYDRSNDSVIIIRRRKRRTQAGPSHSIDLADRAVQTQDNHAIRGKAEEAAPPTYDDVRTEEQIIKRVHPPCSITSLDEADLGSSSMATQYKQLASILEFRCVPMEERLGRTSDDCTADETIVPPAASSIVELPVTATTVFNSTYTDKGIRGLWTVAFVLGFLTSLLLFRLLRGVPYDGTTEDATLWRKSNTLQVPWSSAAAIALQHAERSSFLDRLFGDDLEFVGVRVPT